jgi:hypothetical protein
MQRVETSVLMDATPDDVLAALSPRLLVECMGTFDVIGVEAVGEDTVVRAMASEHDLETELRFTEQPNGYGWEQGEDGPFAEQYTSITVGPYEGPVEGTDLEDRVPEDEARAKVTMRSRFTFGGRFASIKDWFAASTREEELQRALFALAEAVVSDEDGDGGEEKTAVERTTED